MRMAARPVRMAQAGRSKYGVRTDAAGKLARTVDGILFDSQAEARRYGTLKLLLQAGVIIDLELQPCFDLWAAMPLDNRWDYGCRDVALVGCYRADFRYYQRDGELIIEDVKGLATPVYKLKKKLAEACHGIRITEIRR